MLPLMEDYRDELNIIMQCNQYIWEKKTYWPDIEMWLVNFEGIFTSQDIERKAALTLLSKFLYYNEKEIKYLCRNLYSLFKQEIIDEYLSQSPTAHLSDAKAYFDDYLTSCRFSDMGEPGESSGYILYSFRQENDLSNSLFMQKTNLPIAIKQKKVKSLIVVDDFLGSGDTAVRFWDNDTSIQKLRESDTTINFYYLVLLAMEQGIRNVEDNTDFCVISTQMFSEPYRVFSDKSLILHEDIRPITKDICKGYGKRLEGEPHALGYKNSQALIGMHHNIPNNTLPIIWSKNDWHPIFPRKTKVYRMDG
jgi:hypothetical protein